jgi:hypothetical protein
MSTLLNSKEPGMPQLDNPTGVHQKDMFYDNLDHLQALEQEALIRLELSNAAGVEMTDTGTDDFALQIVKSSSSDASVRNRFLEARLHEMAVANREKERRALAKGIPLLFPQLCASYSLDDFERLVVMLLFVANTSTTFKKAFSKSTLAKANTGDDGYGEDVTIGTLLAILCRDYKQQIANRRYFSVESRLIREEIILILGIIDETTNILTKSVHLHERIVRFILGDDCFYDSVLKHVRREKSDVLLDQVIMPDRLKDDVVRLVLSFAAGETKREALGIDTFYGYGIGLTLMFYGPSGTGKTMLAKALAKKLDKTIFTISLRSYSRHEIDDVIRCVFKEARLRDGIVFFDECDDIFGEGAEMSRLLLIEIEKANCITILATNKPFRLDPSLERRITMKVPFAFPDEDLRRKIWRKLVPATVRLNPDVDLDCLAAKYLFSGGLIKNTLFAAISETLGRNGSEAATLNMCDLVRLADYQSVSAFEKHKLGKAYAPSSKFDELPLRAAEIQQLNGLVAAWRHLHSQNHGLNVLVKTANIETGIAAVEATAHACDLKINSYSLAEVLSMDRFRNFQDQQDQIEVGPLEYAFMEKVGHYSVLLFVDYHNQISASMPSPSNSDSFSQADLIIGEFLNNLRHSNRFIFVVSRFENGHRLMPEFHQLVEITLPPEDLQISQWKKYLKGAPHAEIVELVENTPMYLCEIDFTCSQAVVRASMLGNINLRLEHILDVIERYKKTRKSPILFGVNR